MLDGTRFEAIFLLAWDEIFVLGLLSILTTRNIIQVKSGKIKYNLRRPFKGGMEASWFQDFPPNDIPLPRLRVVLHQLQPF